MNSFAAIPCTRPATPAPIARPGCAGLDDAAYLGGASAAPATVEVQERFKDLIALIHQMKGAGTPTLEQEHYLFDAAFLWLDDADAAGDARAAKADLLNLLLQHAPFLVKRGRNPAAALRRNFDRLYHRWQKGDGELAALDDARAGRKRGPELSQEEFNWLVAASSFYGGGCDQAWRGGIREKKLRQEVLDYYANRRRRMPSKYRQQIINGSRDAKMRRHGPRHAELNGPYIRRDPNHPANPLLSGQWDQCDDLTLPCVWYDQRPDGSLWLGQGQFPGWVDERSWLIYNFVLIPEKSYSGFHIRNSWTKATISCRTIIAAASARRALHGS